MKCPHCGLNSLVKDNYARNGQIAYCILCARRFKTNGRRRIGYVISYKIPISYEYSKERRLLWNL